MGRRTPNQAVKSVREIAGMAICSTCPYSSMSTQEISLQRAANAEAAKNALLAEEALTRLETMIASGEPIIQDAPVSGAQQLPTHYFLAK